MKIEITHCYIKCSYNVIIRNNNHTLIEKTFFESEKNKLSEYVSQMIEGIF